MLMAAGLALMKSVPTSLAKSVLLPLRLSGSGITTFIVSNEEMEDIVKIVKSLKESGLIVKGIIETLKKDKRTKKKISSNAIRNISC